MLRSSDVLASVQQRGELGAVLLVGNERERLEHCFKALHSPIGLVSDFCELVEMAGDLTFVPREENRLDICEVLVERRTADAGFLGDLRHRHRSQPVLRGESGGCLQDRFAHLTPVRLDRVAPQLRHLDQHTECLDRDRLSRNIA